MIALEKISMNSLFLSTALSLLFTACNNKGTEGGQTEKEEVQIQTAPAAETAADMVEITEFQYKNIGIQISTLEEKGLSETIKTSGKLDAPPQNYAEVSTYIGAVVKSIRVIEGDFVKQGQVIMTLEHPDFIKLQEEYITTKNNLNFLEKEYQRKKELFEEKAGSGKSFQEAEANYRVERGKLASVQNQLSMLSISTGALDEGIIARTIPLKTPIQGYIGNIYASLGAYVEPNKVLFDVIDNSDIHVHLDVFEKDIFKVKLGQKVSVFLPNQEDQQITAEIFRIGKSIDPKTKTIAVHADIKQNKKQELVPGIFVNGLIHVTERRVPAVPDAALVRSGEKQYLFIVTESHCEKPEALPGNEEACQDSCCTGGASGTAAEKSPPEKDDCCAKDSAGIPLVYKMVEVKTGASALGYTEVIPAVELPENAQVVVKGAYFLISQLKSGETVGCCAPGEEEKKK